MTSDSISAVAKQHGLMLRGSFAVQANDRVPDISQQQSTGYLLLFGNVGANMWHTFCQSPEYHDQQPHPLDRWSRRIGQKMATQFSARALFPFTGPPYLPFLEWAKKAEPIKNSKLGMLMHPQFGLWHAYRFALALPLNAAQPAMLTAPPHTDICAACESQPCLKACPAQAFSSSCGETNYDVHACFNYLQSQPDGPCMTHGCQARVACPQATQYRYTPPHAAFHMRAFVKSQTNKKSKVERNV